MSSLKWMFGAKRFPGMKIVHDRHDLNTETLSQAIRAATSEEPEDDGNVLFGHLRGTVVGLRYYTGVVNKGEMVGLVREPNNPYDSNAVMVANVYGRQVGHIKKELAAAMAYVMDKNLAKVEGVVHSGTNNTYTMPVMLSFWGKEENKNTVTQQMARRGFKLDKDGSSLKGSSSSLYSGSTSFPVKKGVTIALSAEELKNAFDNLFEDLMESKDGEKDAAWAVATPLLLHQKQALSWMCARENKSVLPPFWEKRGELYYNTVTCFSAKEIPERVRGGILADDMGLGKTLTTIALILTNFHKGKPLLEEKCDEPTTETKIKHNEHSKEEGGRSSGDNVKGGSSASGIKSSNALTASVETADKMDSTDEPQKSQTKGKTKATKRKPSKESKVLFEDLDFAAALNNPTSAPGPKKKKKTTGKAETNEIVETFIPETAEDLSARTTLIICPLSVLSNWLDQFEQHVHDNVKLNIYLYYGPERNKKKKFLSSQDVVITTYNVLSAESGNNSPLQSINWLRVVLDEGHVVRNPNAQMSKAVLELKAQRRWILSGTPIQNSVKDLWMLMAFLRLKPFDVREWWNRVIQRPVIQGDRVGLQNLRSLVKCITLRRTKTSKVNGQCLVTLPKKKIYIEQVELSQREREEYELARNEGRNTISGYINQGTVLTNYAHVLAILMRLRQLCCHPDLIGALKSDLDVGAPATPAELRERLIEKLRLVLASGSDEECSVCLDSVRLPVITYCAHVYCRPCIAQVISTNQERAQCPLCRSEIKTSELVEFSQEDTEEENCTNSQNWRTSSKVQALMGNLLRVRSEDSSIKCLVISQFMRFLTILETPLRQHGFSFVRLDGTMNQSKRTQVIQEFQSSANGSPVIMLLSLKAGGVGLNLTAASHVFLMDPAWNPAVEEQCIDRCHRIGQKRNVVVTKFIVKNSVEENMVKIQKKKQDLIDKAFGSSSTDRKTSCLNEIQALMEL